MSITDIKNFVVKFVKEVATLKRPVTAGAVVTTVLGVLAPLGLDLGSTATAISAALVVVGTVAAGLEEFLGVVHFK